jgi:hypothetical protein
MRVEADHIVHWLAQARYQAPLRIHETEQAHGLEEIEVPRLFEQDVF